MRILFEIFLMLFIVCGLVIVYRALFSEKKDEKKDKDEDKK